MGFKWPEVSGGTVFTAFIILLIIIAIIFFTNAIKTRTKVRDEAWEQLLIYALKKGFSQKEVALLQAFFSGLSESEKEAFNLYTNKKASYTMLYSFFLKQEMIPSDQKVKILGSLFFERKADFLPKSTLDLNIGEVCSLETPGKKYLSIVLKKTDSKLLLKNNNWLNEEKDMSMPASVFCFRNGFGGFALVGKIIAVVKEGIVFDYAGKIEKRGEEKLVTSIELPFELKTTSLVRREVEDSPILADDIVNKSLDEIDELLGNKPVKSPPKDKISEKPKTEVVKGTIRNFALTEKISDKSIQFKFVGAVPDDTLRRSEVWEINLKFPSGFIFLAKGNIVQVPNSDGSFLLKFTEVNEDLKQKLIAEIRQLGIDRD